MDERHALRPLRLTSSDGVALAGDDLHGASPPLLFLHGLGSTRAGDKSASLLAYARRRGQRAVRIDFRGHGASAGRMADLTVSGLVADARAALEHTGPAIVIGSSLGGLIAAWTAARHPELVRALVLLAPAFGFLRRLAQRPRRGNQVVIQSQWVQAEFNLGVLDDAARWNEAELPRLLRMPTLLVHGVGDDVVPAIESERLFAAIPHAHKDLWLVEAADGGDHRLTGAIERVWPMLERLLAAP